MSILDKLVEKKIITEEESRAIEKEAEADESKYESLLLKRGVDPADLMLGKGENVGVPVWDMGKKSVNSKALDYIPEESARHYSFVPLGIKDGVLEVGAVNPDNIEGRDALNFISSRIGMPYKLFLISQNDFEKVLDMYKGLSGEINKALSELETELAQEQEERKKEEAKNKGNKGSQEIEEINEDAPVTKIVANIVNFATNQSASDIHIEPVRSQTKVRFRIDGVMETKLTLPAKVHPAVVARIKILSNMRLDEKRKPQDGRFSTVIDNRKIDFRVSTFPTYFGEKVVIRILDQQRGVIPLDQIGLSPKNLEIIRRSIQRSYGLILISGPTGSGKTTTLYSMLNELDRETKNVLSLEDPIEYNIEGLNQSQIHPEIGYTFATGLRTTLRQDPDIIMVGEIRDKETAQLAIHAALTGHLVLSTIHTNDAVGVIPRLIDMGVDPYLIAPTLILAIAQRLVRKLCPDAADPIEVTESIKMMIDKTFADLPPEVKSKITIGKQLFEAKPTAECPQGVKGRAAVMEVLEMDHEIENIVLKGANDRDIYTVARKKGMLSIKEDALLKCFNKEVPFKEVNAL